MSVFLLISTFHQGIRRRDLRLWELGTPCSTKRLSPLDHPLKKPLLILLLASSVALPELRIPSCWSLSYPCSAQMPSFGAVAEISSSPRTRFVGIMTLESVEEEYIVEITMALEYQLFGALHASTDMMYICYLRVRSMLPNVITNFGFGEINISFPPSVTSFLVFFHHQQSQLDHSRNTFRCTLGRNVSQCLNLCRTKGLAPDVGNCTTVELFYKNTTGTPGS